MEAGPREKIFWGSVVVLLLLVISSSSYYGFLSMVKDKEIKKEKAEQSIWGPPKPKAEDLTVLLMGVDNVQGSSRSDTLMLANIEPKEKKIKILSIPRDTRVQLPGRRHYDKITHAHSYGGTELAVDAVSELVNIPIEYYVKLDFTGFESVVDALGGINLDVEKSMKYVDNAGGLKIDIKPGYQHMDGKTALEYVRFRHDAMGDIGRVGRQEQFLKSLAMQAIKPTTFLRLPRIIKELRDSVDTNLSVSKILTLARIFRDVDSSAIKAEILPGTPEYIGGVSYWVPDLPKLNDLVASLFFGKEKLNCRVDVLNGSGIPGEARRLADTLAKVGFDIGRVDNADRSDYEQTEIIDQKGEANAVTKVFDILEKAEYSMNLRSDADADLIIIVGKDIKLK